jgi:prolyl oligopeptidase
VTQTEAGRDDDDDPYRWLEDLDSAEARGWVEAQNAETQRVLGDERFEQDRRALLDILNADDRIPWINQRGDAVYNFWQDAAHPKGLWRRTTLADYRNAVPRWITVLDLDALARQEGEDWVWRGCVAQPPDYRRGLVQLSRGGADANVIREFDLVEKSFVPVGFTLPEAKGSAAWLDQDRLLVASALGGTSHETASGYARTVRLWRRGTPFTAAPVVFEGAREHMTVWGWRNHQSPKPRTFYMRKLDFVRHELFVEDGPGALRRVQIPLDAIVSVHRDWLILNLRSAWTVAGKTYQAGALLVIGFEAFLAGERDFTVLFEPKDRCFLQAFDTAGDAVALQLLDNVRSRVVLARHRDGTWQSAPVSDFPSEATLDVHALDSDDSSWFVAQEQEGDGFLVLAHNTVMPPTLSLVRFGEAPERLKQAPARFDAAGLSITQHEARSNDGTVIPYFQVGRADRPLDGSRPVLLTGYGGFEIPSLPHHSPSLGKLWLERGGTYVIANIRGGGEFGPDWHRAGIRAGKKAAHDDFAAVASDLIARGVTRPERLAAWGGSNGGLLVGNMLTRYGDLFGAINCAVPLLDMRRYTKLTAGPSWIAEYGDPDDPADWAFLREISAYHAVRADKRYPPILLTTSGRDDRVHPGHARKMAARLLALGHAAYFYEPTGGGHAGATDNAQLAFNQALAYAFLRRTVGEGG